VSDIERGVARGVGEAVKQAPNLAGPALGLRSPLPRGPRGSPDVRALAARGIPMTPGQMGLYPRAEEALASLAGVGDIVKGARGRGVDALNTEAWNDALKAAGKKPLPKGMKGQEAAEHVRRELQDNYDAILAKVVVPLDGTMPTGAVKALPAPGQLGRPIRSLRSDLDSLLNLASKPGGLQGKELRTLRSEVKRVKDAFDQPGDKATGEQVQRVLERLREQRQGFGAGDGYQRQLSQALKEVESSVRSAIEEANPKLAKEWSANNDAWARYKIAQRAAGSIGAREGVFKPSQYSRSVRDSDKTKDKRAYSEGKARQQDLSDPAKAVLSDVLPDSGTPYRLSVADMIRNPKALAASLALGIPTAALYSPAGLAMIQRLMLGAPPNMGRAAAGVIPYSAQLQPPPRE
jgi:hypothetical protein